MSAITLEVEEELDDLKLMASGIGVTMIPMPVHVIRCSMLLSKFLKIHPECIEEVVRFALEQCGEQRYARAVMASALVKVAKEMISTEDIAKIKEWQTYEKDSLILKDLETLA